MPPVPPSGPVPRALGALCALAALVVLWATVWRLDPAVTPQRDLDPVPDGIGARSHRGFWPRCRGSASRRSLTPFLMALKPASVWYFVPD